MWCTCSTVLRRRLRRAADPPTNGRGDGLAARGTRRRRAARRAQRERSGRGRGVRGGDREHFGVVHELYNNAGIAFSRSVLETEYGDYERLFAVNLWGVIHGTKALPPPWPL